MHIQIFTDNLHLGYIAQHSTLSDNQQI